MRLLILSLILFLATGCVSQPKKIYHERFALPKAVQVLTDDLLQQLGRSAELKRIAIEPFVDVSSGDVVTTSLEIEALMIRRIAQQFPQFQMQRLSPLQLQQVDYIMVGALDYELEGDYIDQKRYRIHASIIDLRQQKIVANNSVWLAEAEFDYNPVTIYEDSPMFLRDKALENLVAMAKAEVGSRVDPGYYNALEANAVLVAATTAYARHEYDYALQLFEQAASMPAGNTMRTYAGLYQAYRKLGQLDKAELAFAKMFQLGVAERNLSVKFLFQVNSTEFVAHPEIRQQYTMWLRQIGKFFEQTQYCIEILGHTSRTGAERYNQQLSLQRAEKVQGLIAPYFDRIHQRSRSVGRGFLDNIVGSGTDDARDAVDRRVDFQIANCF